MINSPIISTPTEDQDQAMDTEYQLPPTPYIRHFDPSHPPSQSAKMSVSPIATRVGQDQHMAEDSIPEFETPVESTGSRESGTEKEKLKIPKSPLQTKSPTTPLQRPQTTTTGSKQVGEASKSSRREEESS
jgi:hypothetical protein